MYVYGKNRQKIWYKTNLNENDIIALKQKE